MADCRLDLDAANKDEAMRRFRFDAQLDSAIGDMIGFPNPQAMQDAEDSYMHEKLKPAHLRTKKLKKLKKEFLREQRKLNEHNELYDKIRNYTINSADTVGFDERIVNPQEIMNDWKSIFALRLKGHINPVTMQIGPRTMKSAIGLVDRIIKKREHLKKIRKIPTYALFAATPGIVASWADDFGIINKVINKVKILSDVGVSDAHEFSIPMSSIQERLGKIVMNLASANITEFTTEKIFNINNSVMAGRYTDSNGNVRYKGLNGVSQKLTNEPLTILKEGKVHGREGYYAVKQDAEFQEIEFYEKDEVHESDTDIKELLADKYVNELLFELGSGQMRKVIPQLMNPTNPNWKEDQEKLKQKLKQMVYYRERKDGNWRVPGVNTSIHTDENNTTWEYRWVMIKQGEGNAQGEQYNAYLLDKQRFEAGKRVFENESDKVNFVGQNIISILEEVETDDGVKMVESEGKEAIDYDINEIKTALKMENNLGHFMRTDEYNDFGAHQGKEKGTGETINIQGSSKKQFINFKVMENPPNKDIMTTEGGIWESLAEQRSILTRMWAEMSARTTKMTNERKKWDTAIRKQLSEMGKDDDAIDEYFNKLYNTGGLESSLVRDERTGDLKMPHIYMQKKAENYMPSLYNTNSIVFEQIPSQILKIKQKITEFSNVDTDEARKQVEIYKEGLSHLEQVRDQMSGEKDFDSKIYDVNRVHHLKHITAWTDPTKIRKDQFAMSDYFNHTFNTINRNELIIEMMKGVHQMNMVHETAEYGQGHVDGALDYMVNRVKIGLGDTGSRAITMFGNETSYDDMAEKLNNSSLGRATGIEWDGESAERLTKWMTAPMTMYHLGSGGAFVNQTQMINDFVKVGWHITTQGDKLLKEDKQWEKVIEKTGVLNVLSIFQDIMLQGGDVKGTDAGIYNIGGIPIPTKNLYRFMKLLSMGRDKFINDISNHKEIDDFLAMLEQRHGKGKGTAEIRELREANNLRKGLSDATMREKAGVFYDIFAMDENQTEKLIKQRFKKLIGDVADAELKRMVSWKLTWWLPAGKDVFTFTGTEEKLRKRSVITSMLYAQSQGLLGKGRYLQGDGKGDISPFLTDRAIKIGRDGVYSNQFGMTPPHIGEGFNGFGRNVFQYKQYPTLQIIHDYNVWKNFTDGNYSNVDGMQRIVKAVIETGKLSKPYDPADKSLDHEALAMARLLSTRMAASLIASFASMIPFFGWFMRSMSVESYGLLRGAENPAVGLAMRTVIWAAFAQSGGDEEDDLLRGIGILLIPVFLGTMLRAGFSIADFTDSIS